MQEPEEMEREEFLDYQDPLRHLRSPDADGVLVPAQPPSILSQRTDLVIPGINPGDPGITVKLALDAAPGCGGIAWPAGEASDMIFVQPEASRKILSLSFRGRSILTGPQLVSPPTRPFLPQNQNRSRTGQRDWARRSSGKLHRCRTCLDNRSKVCLVAPSLHLHFRPRVMVRLLCAPVFFLLSTRDTSPLLDIMRQNVRLNSLLSTVTVAELNWCGASLSFSLFTLPRHRAGNE